MISGSSALPAWTLPPLPSALPNRLWLGRADAVTAAGRVDVYHGLIDAAAVSKAATGELAVAKLGKACSSSTPCL